MQCLGYCYGREQIVIYLSKKPVWIVVLRFFFAPLSKINSAAYGGTDRGSKLWGRDIPYLTSCESVFRNVAAHLSPLRQTHPPPDNGPRLRSLGRPRWRQNLQACFLQLPILCHLSRAIRNLCDITATQSSFQMLGFVKLLFFQNLHSSILRSQAISARTTLASLVFYPCQFFPTD